MRKILTIFTAIAAASLAVWAAAPSLRAQTQEEPRGIETADKYFSERLYSKAIEAYKPFMQSENKELRYEAELKTAEAYYYQNKFDAALSQIYSYRVPSDSLWKARYYLVKFALLNSSPYQSPQYQETTDDPTKFTLEQKEAEKKDILLKLWNMRKELAEMPFENSRSYILIPSYYIDTNSAAQYPTLFDYMVKLWASNETKPEAEIYEQAYKIKGAGRAAAAELWHIARVDILPVEGNDVLALKANWMSYIAGLTNAYNNISGVKKYIFQANNTLPKAKAAYKAAEYYNSLGNYEDSVKALDYCLGLELNVITDTCRNLKETITKPNLFFGENQLNAEPNKEYNLQVYARNVDKFYIHIFKLAPLEIASVLKEGNNFYSKITLNKPTRTLGVSVSYDRKYATHTSNIVLPKEKSGLYILKLSEEKEYKPSSKDSKWNSQKNLLINFTDTAVAATAYSKPKNIAAQTSLGDFYNIYAVDAKTGLPKQGVKLESNMGKTVFTGANGLGSLERNNKTNKYKTLSLLASKNGNYAFLNGLLFQRPPAEKYLLALNTSMSIYKAGQTIEAQITAAELKGEEGYLLAEGKEIKISLRGPNYDILEEETLKLDNMGSASYSYDIPQDAMLGVYHIQANLDDSYTLQTVNVEAFKTPAFEVTLLENTEGVKFGKPFEIKGKAKYYYGSNTEGAKVSYTIEKRNFFPIFWRTAKIYAPFQKVQQGTTRTDKDGAFKITFTPENAPAEYSEQEIPVQYTVRVYVTDEAGDTIQAEKAYIASRKEKFFDIQTNKGFLRAGAQNAVEVKMTNVNGKALSGRATARLFAAQAPEKWKEDSPLEKQLKRGEIIKIDKVEFNKDAPAQYILPPLKEGWYILSFTAEGEEYYPGNDNIAFMAVNIDKPAISLPENTTIAESDVYYPGEQALILLGSQKAKSNKYIELYSRGFLLYNTALTQEGPAILRLPIKKDYQGGFVLKWFSVYNYELFQGEISVKVPYINSKLSLELSGTEVSLPGANKTVSLTVLDENKTPANARALITVYDKAMDYYQPHSFNTLGAYQETGVFNYNSLESSLDPIRTFYTPRMFALNSAAAAIAPKAAVSAAGGADYAAMDTAVAEEASSEQGAAQSLELRTDFSVNALWLPDLNVKDGFSEFTFKLPQSATEWKILAAAFTKNAKTGTAAFEFATSKNLMAELKTPRFLRNGDEIEIQALISNTTDKAMPAEVKLTVNQNCSDGLDNCETLEYEAKNITLKAKEQSVVKWAFKAPKDGDEISFALTAKNAELSDGELKTIPLLPASQNLAASQTVALKQGTNSLTLSAPGQDAEIQAVHLSLSPSLLMPVLNAMPLLAEASRTSATYTADAYFTLALFNKLYNDYPQLKEAAAKLPKRNSVSPAWDINEKLLLNDIAQSPWYLLAKGYNQQNAVIDLFDAQTAAERLNQAQKDLAKFQNKDGGYAWVKGGSSNMFITLRVLESFAQAYRYGVDIDQQTAKKALDYIAGNYSDEDINIGIYSAYILTAFPKEWNPKGRELALKALSAFENSPLQTPLAYAYAASVYKRLGENEKADLQIERLFDTASYSDITGISWTMEERSWQWFEDGITLHAAAIEALNEVRPEDSRIEGLAKWLIFNEKAQAWGSPQSAAKAVYALMGIMLRNNILNQIKDFTITWNGEIKKITARPYDLDLSPLTFSAYGKDITPSALSAVVNKTVAAQEGSSKDFDDYATLSALFIQTAPEQASKGGMISVEKAYYLIKDGKASYLKNGDQLNPGDEVEARLTIKSQSAFDFVVLSDPKPAGFETDTLLSGWKYDGQLPRYEELKENTTNFFLQKLPQGAYELKYTMRPTSAGAFTSGAAQVQSMYMPEMTAHSAGFKVKVK